MPHPNSLPDAKVDYIYSLMRQKRLRLRFGAALPELTLLLFHCEVPYGQACTYLDRLAGSGMSLPALVTQLPDAKLQQLFAACGAGHADATGFIATLNAKR
jgi:hypothetical protein